MKACVLIPIYNHGATIYDVVTELKPLGLRCLIINDGSDSETRAVLAQLERAFSWVSVEHHDRNLGRGAALKTGFRLASRLGYTHALQIDADGQHDPSDAPIMLEFARNRPEALILGSPIFDSTAPRARRYGHWISRIWVWIETCSLAIDDPLCGLRCTPLEPTLRIINRIKCGQHMEFEPEIAVRLFWAGLPVVNVPTRVRYYSDGISHFDLFRDNVRISWLHTRLFFSMLPRLGRLIARNTRSAT